MNKLLNWLYLSPVRSIIRRLGIINIFRLFGEVRTQWLYFQYNQKQPKIVEACVDNCKAILNVKDKREYIRVLSLSQDKHIIKTLLEGLKPGETCWDVGSNIGLYTVLLAKAVGEKGKVLAFEPEEKSFERLLQNMELNKLNNVYPLHMALGQKNEKMKLKIHGHYASGAHSLVLSESDGDNNEYENVDVVQGDDLIVKKGLEIPKVIKIDVEGAEEDVLIGLTKTLCDNRCRLVVCEVHFSILALSGRKDVPLKIIRHLKDYGFENLTWLDKSHLAASKKNN